MIRSSLVVHVADPSEVSAARRVAQQCAESMKLGENASARAALITTELATNLVKHAGGGSIIFGSDDDSSLSIVSIDKGSGIRNVAAAMRDGYSTAGSPGTGLGAIARSATAFDIHTHPDKGTAILCRVSGENGQTAFQARPPRVVVGGICVPKRGEEENGDGWVAMTGRDVVTVAVVDGLGHGPAASMASATILRVIRQREQLSLENMLEDAHGEARATRGAAVGIARLFPANGRVDFAGIGNIAATIANDDGHRKTVSLPGIVGHEMRRVQSFSYPWTGGSILVMQSDGLSSSWNFGSYPGLTDRDPMLIAAVLFRDHCRGTDDATVVVAKATQ